ncbi:MAG: BlaI/MecI/CopY family transcriptional regulator [Phycisphaerales bacterium]|nr:BlaI/MecI/CopY family transcriptional regulator [Phycisphaerales bacterium]
MKKKPQVRPTDAELEILGVFWQMGPASVGQIHKHLHAEKGTTYNTTLKLMQIMHEKGLLTRDESRRPQIYSATVAEEKLQQHLVRDLLHRAFGGSARKLVAALTATHLSITEKEEIRKLLRDSKNKSSEPRPSGSDWVGGVDRTR